MPKSKGNEFALKRRIRELENEVFLLKQANEVLAIKKEKKAKVVLEKNGCPKCESNLIEMRIPSGVLILCSSSCGYRKVKKIKSEELRDV